MVGQRPEIAVYIMASARNGTLYVGVTSKLGLRVEQHKLGTFEGFSKRYACKSLLWWERHATMPPAILREKQIKRWRREKKVWLIESLNPDWHDLSKSEITPPQGMTPRLALRTRSG